MSFFSKLGMAFAAAVVATGVSSASAQSFTTGNVTWNGVTFQNSGLGGDWRVNGSNDLELRTPSGGTSDIYAIASANAANAAIFGPSGSLNINNTPWVEYSFRSNFIGTPPGAVTPREAYMFFNGISPGPSNARWLAGRYFSADVLVVQRYNNPTTQALNKLVTPNTSPSQGQLVTIRCGKTNSGILEFTVTLSGGFADDGTYYASTSWLRDNTGGDRMFDFLEFQFITRNNGTSGFVTTFEDFTYGGNYVGVIPEPASLGFLGLGSMLLLARRRKA